MSTFALEKWYFDTVTPEGRTFIGYSAELKLFGLKVPYAQSLVCGYDQKPELKNGFRKHEKPIVNAHNITCNTGLFQVDAERTQKKDIKERLYDDGKQHLIWHCLETNTNVSVHFCNKAELQGRGYVEKLSMTIKPWMLPINELWWGRFTGKRHSVVWIHWEHALPQSWLFINGQKQSEAKISREIISSTGMRLAISHQKTLIDAKPFREHTRLLGFILPASMRHMHEQKWLATGLLNLDGEEDHGFLIHERVSFKNIAQ